MHALVEEREKSMRAGRAREAEPRESCPVGLCRFDVAALGRARPLATLNTFTSAKPPPLPTPPLPLASLSLCCFILLPLPSPLLSDCMLPDSSFRKIYLSHCSRSVREYERRGPLQGMLGRSEVSELPHKSRNLDCPMYQSCFEFLSIFFFLGFRSIRFKHL